MNLCVAHLAQEKGKVFIRGAVLTFFQGCSIFYAKSHHK